MMLCVRSLSITAVTAVFLSASAQKPQYPNYPSETPAHLEPATRTFDFTRREVMIPMRDGVKLHTVILVPKGAAHAPMLLTRTPYDASAMTTHVPSSHLGPNLYGYDNATDVIVEGGYIRVTQDIRGKYGSEGDFVMNRPLHGPQNPTPVDESTDTYDTIDWLVKNVPESNGKVGILGISYDGFLPLMALVHPHPALKVSVPMNPMVDGWMGDDWFHNGAFRQQNLPYIYEQEGTRENDPKAKWWVSHFDDYDEWMSSVSAGEEGRRHGMDQFGFFRKLTAHPAYDAFWSDQALDKALAADFKEEGMKVPILLVHSLWDQEDIYGAPAVYRAIKPLDKDNDKVFMVLGPWHHGQEIEDAASLGAIRFGADTGTWFRQNVLRPFLDRYLKDDAPAAPQIAQVTSFETGANRWQKLDAWPVSPRMKPLYLQAGFKLGWEESATNLTTFDEYISDPAKPVPFRARPSQPVGYEPPFTWTQWLVDDQREPSGRTDVLSYTSDVLTLPVHILGQPIVNLVASTSGTDSDWVVKLIDVYPDEVAGQPTLGGYQLAVAMDIIRGRYRESFSAPKPIEPDKPLTYRFPLPAANHVFLPGHRIMVQVQSSWFPLYDRNPQTYVENIFWAKPEDYKKATQRVYHAPGQASAIELPVVAAE
jgi:putative CocE/NonD family hydrolase